MHPSAGRKAARQRLDSEWARTCFADPEDYDRLTAEWNQEVLEANAGEHRTTTCMCLPWDSIARQQ